MTSEPRCPVCTGVIDERGPDICPTGGHCSFALVTDEAVLRAEWGRRRQSLIVNPPLLVLDVKSGGINVIKELEMPAAEVRAIYERGADFRIQLWVRLTAVNHDARTYISVVNFLRSFWRRLTRRRRTW